MNKARFAAGATVVVALAVAGVALRYRAHDTASERSPTPPSSTAAEVRSGATALAKVGPRPPLRGSGRVWRVGARRTYAVDMTDDLHLASKSAAVSGAGVKVALHGEWVVTVLSATDDRVELELALKLPSLDVRGSGGDTTDPAARARLVERASVPFFATSDPFGRLTGLAFRTDVDGLARSILASTAARSQFVVPRDRADQREKWEAEETDPTGDYVAKYARGPTGSFTKAKHGYVRLARSSVAIPLEGPAALQATSAFGFELDQEGWPTLQTGHERLRAQTSGVGIESEGSLALRLLTSEVDAPYAATRATAPRPDYVQVGLSVGGLSPAGSEQADRALLGKASFASLVSEITGLTKEQAHARAIAVARLSSAFRLDPSAIRRAQGEVARGTDANLTDALLAGLQGAATPAAQAALAEIAETPRIAVETRESAVASLGLSEHPTTDSLAALKRLTGDTATRGTALLALGNLADNFMKDGNVDAGNKAIDELLALLAGARTDDDRAEILKALGNTASVRALAAITDSLASPSPAVRAAALFALRFMNDPSVDPAIASAMVGDPEPAVRGAGIDAFEFRDPSSFVPAVRKMLADEALVGLRLRLVAALGKRLRELETVCGPLLQWSAAHDPSPEVKEAAAAALARVARPPR